MARIPIVALSATGERDLEMTEVVTAGRIIVQRDGQGVTLMFASIRIDQTVTGPADLATMLTGFRPARNYVALGILYQGPVANPIDYHVIGYTGSWVQWLGRINGDRTPPAAPLSGEIHFHTLKTPGPPNARQPSTTT